MNNKVKSRVKMISITAAMLISAAAILILFLDYQVEKNGHYRPSYSKKDIQEIAGDGIKESEYQELFFQTGLGRDAVDNIVKNEVQIVRELEKYQNNFFAENPYQCSKITPITGEEQSVDEEGNRVSKFEIQGLEDGDIFISLSTHSLGWRHGHAAIVADSLKGMTLESLVLGKDSEYQNYEKWELYPTFIQLRIKKEALEQLGKDMETARATLSKTSKMKLSGIPYNLLAGIPSKYVRDVSETHCAHLVWYAYKELGIDIDSDKGIFITPYDMVESDLLEIVQIYGVNPKEYMGDLD